MLTRSLLPCPSRPLFVGRSGHQSFQYLTPRARISPVQLPDTPFGAKAPSYVHFVCSPLRAAEIVSELDALDFVQCGKIWEPMPVSTS